MMAEQDVKSFFTNAIFVVRNLRLCDKKGPKSSNKHGRYNKMNSWFIKLLSQQLLLILIACLNLFLISVFEISI